MPVFVNMYVVVSTLTRGAPSPLLALLSSYPTETAAKAVLKEIESVFCILL